MRVLWVTNIILPEFAHAIGLEVTNFGGWMPSLLKAIQSYAAHVEISVLSEGPIDAECCINGVNYYLVKSRSKKYIGRRSSERRFFKRINSIVNAKNYSLIHFHGTEYGYQAFPTWVWGDVPKIVSLQGIINGCYQHYCGGLTNSELRPYRNWLRWFVTGFSIQSNADKWRKIVAENERVSLRNIKCGAF